MSKMKILRPSISKQKSFVTVSRKYKENAELVENISKHLKKMKSNGEYEKILKDYFGENELK